MAGTVARDIERRKDDGLQRRLHVVGEVRTSGKLMVRSATIAGGVVGIDDVEKTEPCVCIREL